MSFVIRTGCLFLGSSLFALPLSQSIAVPASGGDLGAPAAVQISLPAKIRPQAIVESDLARTIRAQLGKSLSEDPALRNRDISFSVDEGDVTVTGHVQSNAEREMTNEIAMSIPGVRSVANALRVLP